MSKVYDKLEISLSSYNNEHYIKFEKIDTRIGQVFNYELKADLDTLNELSKTFGIEIDTIPF